MPPDWRKRGGAPAYAETAPVELALDTMAQVRILDIAEDYVEYPSLRSVEVHIIHVIWEYFASLRIPNNLYVDRFEHTPQGGQRS